MILNPFFVSFLLAFNALGQDIPSPSADQYLFGLHKLFPAFDEANQFDGPPSVSSAPITTPLLIIKPTREEMKYYSYYTGSINCGFSVTTMECYYCAMIKGDITNYVVLDNSTHDTRAIVALSEKRKEIVVVFRATVNFWNTVLDAYILNASPPGVDRKIKIHRGFYIATMSLYDRVVKTVGNFRLTKKQYESYKIVITGHSLGGSMARVAQFLFLYLKQFPGVSMEVYTYGEPRSGNKHYVDFLNNQNVKTARVVNRADLLSHLLPPSILGTTAIITDFYYHVQNEYWINGEQEMFTNRSVYEDPDGGNSYGPLYTVVDHFFYFDVNYYRYLSDVHQYLAVPIIFQPTDVLPPLPKPIQIALSDVGESFRQSMYPSFG